MTVDQDIRLQAFRLAKDVCPQGVKADEIISAARKIADFIQSAARAVPAEKGAALPWGEKLVCEISLV